MEGIERRGEIEGILEDLGIPKCWSLTKKSCTVQGMERLQDKDSCVSFPEEIKPIFGL